MFALLVLGWIVAIAVTCVGAIIFAVTWFAGVMSPLGGFSDKAGRGFMFVGAGLFFFGLLLMWGLS